LQAIYKDRPTRQRVFEILEQIVPDDIDAENGRPGMDLWSILVLGTLRLNLQKNFDLWNAEHSNNDWQRVRPFPDRILHPEL
jgi:hypothetical protein